MTFILPLHGHDDFLHYHPELVQPDVEQRDHREAEPGDRNPDGSVTPLQMLTGKIIALGLVGALQTVVWSGAGYLLLRVTGQSIDLGAFQLPVSILLWGMVYFILGYAVYASLMAGIGPWCPT